MRGRRVPPLPPFKQVTGLNPSVEEMTQAIAGQAGVFVLNVAHDDWCMTLKTGRGDDCNCSPDHQLLRYAGKGGVR